MKYSILNRKNLLSVVLLSTVFGLNAQIESKHTDEKYNYTTVVYKDKAASDQDVLNALNNSTGMGDVIRISVAPPPKPVVAPVVDTAKGEDTWLKPTSANSNNLTAATTIAQVINVAPLTVNAAPLAAPVSAPAMELINVTETQEVAEAPVDIQSTQAVSSSRSVKAKSSKSKSYRTAKKYKNRSSKLKKRKRGKQRYSCPKF